MNNPFLLKLSKLYGLILFFSCFNGLSYDQSAFSQQRIVELPLVDGKYDASPLINNIDANKESDLPPLWNPWSIQSRLGLMLLKNHGILEDYEVLDDRIRLVFSAEALTPLRRLLTPPQLLNLDRLDGQRQIAIFVHGLEGSPSNFSSFSHAMEKEGWFPLLLAYPNDGPIEIPSDFLRDELVKLSDRFPQSRIIVIAHSFGGIISWKALSEAGDLGVTDFIALGVPFQGSALARYQPELELIGVILQLIKGRNFRLDIISDGQGEAVDILVPDSLPREKILANPLPESLRLHTIGGNVGPIEPADKARLAEMLEEFIKQRKPTDSLANDLRHVISSREIFLGEGDGVVTTASALWPTNASSKRIFEKSHMGLLKIENNHDELWQWLLKKLNQ